MNEPSKHERAILATMVEVSFMLGAVMVILWAVTFWLWKQNPTDPESMYARSFIIWTFQMGFAGSLYLIFVPIVRHSSNYMVVRGYHYLAAFIGLCVLILTGANLILNDMLGLGILWFVAIPGVMAWAMVKHKESVGGFTTGT